MSIQPTCPATYSRCILLAVAARSPQIVTETFYALAARSPRCLPDEIHVITTRRGEPCIHKLLGDSHTRGQLQRLCDDYQWPYPCFQPGHIHIIEDAQGRPLDDIRTHADNTHAADYITGIVQQLTADADSRLIVSLSGGRRTMTFYVGYALSLFGRAQDRLTHVLVEDEYFFLDEFYYPPPDPTWVVRRDGSGFDASQVEVTLAEIPFVRLRDGLPVELLEGKTSFSHAVSAAQHEISPPHIELRCHPAPQLLCAGQAVAMPPVELAFYTWFLCRRKAGKDPVRWSDPGLAEEFLGVYSTLFGSRSGDYERIAQALCKGMSKEYFESRKSRTNSALKQSLGKASGQRYLIEAYGKRPATRFGVKLDAAVIEGLPACGLLR